MSRSAAEVGRTNIGSRVTDRNLAIVAFANVLFDIPCYGLDVRSSVTGRDVVDQLVAGEEQKKIIVFLELVHGGKHVLQVGGIVRLSGFVSADGVFRGVDIECEIDASIGQGFHAFVVILAVINGIDSDGIDAQLLEPGFRDQLVGCCAMLLDSLGNVAFADGGISEWIGSI